MKVEETGPVGSPTLVSAISSGSVGVRAETVTGKRRCIDAGAGPRNSRLAASESAACDARAGGRRRFFVWIEPARNCRR
jgi:hypothetical protein